MATQIGYQEATESTTVPDWYQNLYRDLLQRGSNQAWNTPGYGGQLNAGWTPQQAQAGNMLQSAMGQWQPTFNQGLQGFQNAAGTIGAGLGTIGSAIAPTQAASQYNPEQFQQFMNPYTQNVVNEIARVGNQNLQQNILPGIADQFTSLGQFGSGRQAQAMGRASAEAAKNILGQQTQALQQGYGQAQDLYGQWANRGMAGAQQIAGIGGQQVGAGQAQAGIGGQQIGAAGQQQGLLGQDIQSLYGYGQQYQQNQQQALDRNYQEWLRQQGMSMDQLSKWGTMFGQGKLPGTTTTSGTTSQLREGGLAMLARGGPVRNFKSGGASSDDDEDPVARFENLVTRLINQESGGNPSARSRKGARGLMQLMPETARESAAKLGYGDLYNDNMIEDPAWNQTLGRKYLLDQLDAFGGDEDKALAAYNAGPGRTRRAVRLGGDDWLGLTPRETQDYVGKVALRGPAPTTVDESVVTGRPTLAYAPAGETEVGRFAPVGADMDFKSDMRTAILEGIQRRRDLLERAASAPEFAAVEEPSEMQKIGRAMFESSAAGPANWGTMLGRAGQTYFDQEEALRAENAKRAQQRFALQEKLSETKGLGGGLASQGMKLFRGSDGSQWALDPTTGSKTMLTPGSYDKEILAHATRQAEEQVKGAEYEGMTTEQKRIEMERLVKRNVETLRQHYSMLDPGVRPISPGAAPTTTTAPAAAPAETQGAPAAVVPAAGVPAAAVPAGGIEVPTTGQKKEREEVGKTLGESFKTYTDAGSSAQTQLAQLGQVAKYLENVDTSKFEEAALPIKQWADAFGVKLDKKIDSREALQSAIESILLHATQAQKGTQSEADARRISASFANFGKTTEGNKKILADLQRFLERSVKVSNMATEYWDKNGTMKGFEKEKNDWMSKNPLFPTRDELKRKYNLEGGGESAPAKRDYYREYGVR